MKPRLSMKLLYELRGDYLMEFSQNQDIQEEAMKRTADFLAFVSNKLKTTTK